MDLLQVYLTGFMQWLLRVTVQASVLIFLILAVQFLLRHKLTPRWRYSLWLLLLVRLMLPWTPQSRMSIFNLLPSSLSFPTAHIDNRFISSPSAITMESADPIIMVSPLHSRPSTYNLNTPPTPITESPPAATKTVDISAWMVDILPLIWLGGALAMLGYISGANLLFWRRIKQQTPLRDPYILDLLKRCKKQMRVHTPLPVVISEHVESPALFGFVRPRLLLPLGIIERLSRQQLRCVFLHELAHLKRNDILTGWLMTLLQVMHWFNPLIWWTFYRMRSDRELACDSLVLSRMPHDESKQYGCTIVYMLEHFSWLQRLPNMAGILENKALLKRRIVMIAQAPKNSKIQVCLMAGILALLVGVALTDARAQVIDHKTVNTALTDESPKATDESPKATHESPKPVEQSPKPANESTKTVEQSPKPAHVENIAAPKKEPTKATAIDKLNVSPVTQEAIQTAPPTPTTHPAPITAQQKQLQPDQLEVEKHRQEQTRKLDQKIKELYAQAVRQSQKRDYPQAIETLKLLLVLNPENDSAKAMLNLIQDFQSFAEQKAAEKTKLLREIERAQVAPQSTAPAHTAYNPTQDWDKKYQNPPTAPENTVPRDASAATLSRQVYTKLNRTLVELRYLDQDLFTVLMDLENQSEIDIEPIWQALQTNSGIEPMDMITIDLQSKIPLSRALDMILQMASAQANAKEIPTDTPLPKAAYTVKAGIIIISSEDSLQEDQHIRIYDITDVVHSNGGMRNGMMGGNMMNPMMGSGMMGGGMMGGGMMGGGMMGGGMMGGGMMGGGMMGGGMMGGNMGFGPSLYMGLPNQPGIGVGIGPGRVNPGVGPIFYGIPPRTPRR
ncbi:M56 family metallopeptidase [Planctomycetota bacterium]